MTASRTSHIKAQLEEDIIEGRLLPGERLEESSLARRFDVSRTPIREALRELAHTGLAELRPQRGCFVAEISLQNVLEILEVMASLEALCAQLAARRMSSQERQQLLAIHKSSKSALESNDYDGYYAINAELHRAIYQGSHNKFLSNQAQNMHRRLTPYRRLQLRRPQRLPESYKEHSAIVNAIVSGDTEQASQHMLGHISIQPDAFYDFVVQLSQKPHAREA